MAEYTLHRTPYGTTVVIKDGDDLAEFEHDKDAVDYVDWKTRYVVEGRPPLPPSPEEEAPIQ